MAIKFNIHNITDGKTTVRVFYSLDNNRNAKPEVTIFAKDYGMQLAKIFDNVQNDTDIMTDYFDKDTIRLHEGDVGYAEARIAAERAHAAVMVRIEAKQQKWAAKRAQRMAVYN